MPAKSRACIVSTPHPAQMFLFTHLDHDVELMIVAEVEELTKFRACTRQFKRMIKDYNKVIKHEHIARPLHRRLDDSNVYLRMVTMGIVNASHDVCGMHCNGRRHNIRADRINRWQDGMNFVCAQYSDYDSEAWGHGNTLSRWVGRDGEHIPSYQEPSVEKLEDLRRKGREKWGDPAYAHRDFAAYHQVSRQDHIPRQCAGLKLDHPLSRKNCGQIDLLLRDMGATGYKSKRKAEKMALWWKLTMAQNYALENATPAELTKAFQNAQSG